MGVVGNELLTSLVSLVLLVRVASILSQEATRERYDNSIVRSSTVLAHGMVLEQGLGSHEDSFFLRPRVGFALCGNCRWCGKICSPMDNSIRARGSRGNIVFCFVLWIKLRVDRTRGRMSSFLLSGGQRRSCQFSMENVVFTCFLTETENHRRTCTSLNWGDVHARIP